MKNLRICFYFVVFLESFILSYTILEKFGQPYFLPIIVGMILVQRLDTFVNYVIFKDHPNCFDSSKITYFVTQICNKVSMVWCFSNFPMSVVSFSKKNF